MLGSVAHKAAAALQTEEVADYFARLIQRVVPKSYKEARKEVLVTAKFLENFSGDQVRTASWSVFVFVSVAASASVCVCVWM